LAELEGLSRKVFMDRYSMKDDEGSPLEAAPDEMWERVARGIAAAEPDEDRREYWEEEFLGVLQGFKFVPAGRILAGVGTGHDVTFFNCYVIPSPTDSRQGIMDSVGTMVEIMSRGGGVGVNLSSLRPRGAHVAGVNGTSSGPVSWAELYSTGTGQVIQGGSRRGALMIMLNDWHPDVVEFIQVKQDLSRINNANLSVCISDRFMDAVKRDADWDLIFPDTTYEQYENDWTGDIDTWLEAGHPVITYDTVPARDIWDKIYRAAWNSGEPGVCFIERYNKSSNSWYFNKIISTNPCGEQGLPPWGVCNLGAINLSQFVVDGQVDWDGLKRVSRVGVRFLDDVIDATPYHFPENEIQQLGERRIGLGTMGLADMLIKLGIRYGSAESLNVVEQVYSTITNEAYRMSVELAQEKGPFPKLDREKHLQGEFIQRLPADIRRGIERHGIRNVALITQAPTGSTSLLAGSSSGIEPIFALKYVRRDRIGTHEVWHPLVKKWLEEHDEDDPAKLPEYFVTASDLTPMDHVCMQAVIQRYTDSSISKTVNAPREHTLDDAAAVYMEAYDRGCKGVTYFREGSREAVLTRAEPEDEKESGDALRAGGDTYFGEIRPIERPASLKGVTYRKPTPVGNLYLTLNVREGYPFELFAQIGKAGSDVSAFTEAIARLVSLAFRCGIDPAEVAGELTGIGGSRSVGFGSNRVRSVPDAIGQFLTEYLRGLDSREDIDPAQLSMEDLQRLASEAAAGKDGAMPSPNGNTRLSFNLCPECGTHALVYEEGCSKCLACGYSEC